jgi:SAM-dependent methyltransferase
MIAGIWMLQEEAKWFNKAITQVGAEHISPMLNIGSSTGHFRTVEQPWIDEYVFGALERGGGNVIHSDIKHASGVDIVGDLTDAGFLNELQSMRFKSVFCSNLLEHVRNPQQIAQAMRSVVEPGGFIFASCPHDYPIHLDPIDTLFRPDVEELSALFPNSNLILGEIIQGPTYWDVLRRRPSRLPKTVLRYLAPFYRYQQWCYTMTYLAYLRKPFTATCVLLKTT